MYYPSFQQLQNYVNEGYKYLPVALRKKINSFDPIRLYNRVKKSGKYHFIFESGKVGRYTYIGYDPLHVISAKNGRVIQRTKNGMVENFAGKPLAVLKDLMNSFLVPRIEGLPKFYGGAVGYFSYDMAKYFENIPNTAVDDLELPDLYFMLIDKLWVYDNKEKELFYIEYINIENIREFEVSYHNKIKKMQQVWETVIGNNIGNDEKTNLITTNKIDHTNDRTRIEHSFSKEEFVKAVKRIQEYIANGDVFQVNLSVRQSRQIETQGIDIYRHLREINPSPYMGYLSFSDLQLVSGSPELLIDIRNQYVQTRPIAGTRPRGNNQAEDENMIKELISNEKEIAEHIMLVDLERNDLGRVCKFGSVKVNELMVVEKYSHVMHIVSNVIGEIAEKYDIYDCIKATFPGGTITGAPKIRTMEIIEELEPVKRGPYTGSMGWIGFHGDLELNILIRTLVIKNGKGYIQAGAGIVIDSLPENEYIESLNKVEAIWRAVESSEEEKKRGKNI